MELALAIPVTVALAVLLGDDEVIGREIAFYQRLLARDVERKETSAEDQVIFATWSGDIIEQLRPSGEGVPSP